MPSKNKILVVAAHPDDELLGVGGTLLKHIDQGDEVSVLILGDGESSKDYGADIDKRSVMARNVADFIGAKNLILKKLPDQQFDSIPILDIIKQIETVVTQVQPNIIYTHCPTDLNIDHRLACEATLVACRPQPNFPVKKILAFETLSSTEWQIKDGANMFCPTHYENIEKYIDKKLKALKIYTDELREYPHPRSEQGIKTLAQYRGMEVGYQSAEAFQLIRNLED